jgi:hypothetical protein
MTSSKKPGKPEKMMMEWWSNGVMGYNTPSLPYSITP